MTQTGELCGFSEAVPAAETLKGKKRSMQVLVKGSRIERRCYAARTGTPGKGRRREAEDPPMKLLPPVRLWLLPGNPRALRYRLALSGTSFSSPVPFDENTDRPITHRGSCRPVPVGYYVLLLPRRTTPLQIRVLRAVTYLFLFLSEPRRVCPASLPSGVALWGEFLP